MLVCGAGARLPHRQRELAGMRPRDRFVGRGDDRFGLRLVERAERDVHRAAALRLTMSSARISATGIFSVEMRK